MKIVLLFIFLSFVDFSQAQINFADPTLKAILARITVDDARAKDASGNPIVIDANGNQEIEIAEALQVYRLNIDNNDNIDNPIITDLDGIQFFTNLTHLSVTTNDLQTIDVRALINLTDLTCNENPRLTNLNVSGLEQLDSIVAFNCNISALDISGCTNLKHLICYNNSLQQIDFSGIQTLEVVLCHDNELTNLNLSGNRNLTVLLCRNNNLSFIYAKETALGLFGFEGNPNLEYICIDSDKVDSIQQKAINYGYFNCVVNDACNLSVKDYNNPEFTLFPNPAADVLNIISDTTMIQSVAIYNVLGQKIISIHENAIAAIDVSSLKTGNYFIKINSDKGTTNAKFAKK